MPGPLRKLAIEDPFIASGGGSVIATTTFYVLASAPSGGDDYAMLQGLIDTYVPLGIRIMLRDALYLVSQGLVIHSYGEMGNSYAARISGYRPRYGGNQDKGTTIRATAAMPAVLTVKSPYHVLNYFRLDANYLATRPIYFSGAAGEGSAFCRLKELHFYRGLQDGAFWDHSAAVSDNTLLDTCWAYNNGTIYASAGIRGIYQSGGVDNVWRTQLAAGTAATTTGIAEIVGTGTLFLSLGLRVGDTVRVGPGVLTADYMQVLSVDSDLHITCYPQSTATATVAGAPWAAFIGDGINFSATGGQNGIMRIHGGLYRENAAANIRSRAQYSHEIKGAQIETSAIWGLQLGIADANQPLDFSANIQHLYFEGNTVASMWLGQILNPFIGPCTSGDPAFIKSPPGITFRTRTGHGVAGPFPLYGALQLEGDKVNVLGNFARNGYVDSGFVFELFNDGSGALKHRMTSDAFTGDSTRNAGKINNAYSGFVTTPAVNSTTPFAFGAGIFGGGAILFDTPEQATPGVTDAIQDMSADFSLVRNGTGAPLYADVYYRVDNINGATRMRPAIQFRSNSDAAVTLDTTTIPAGKAVAVRVGIGLR